MPGFKGYLSDLGGPSANMYRMGGRNKALCAKCIRPSCIFPAPCRNLDNNHRPLIDLYRKATAIKGIKKALDVYKRQPNGDLRKLNEGATVLDFAFDIHSNLGASCVGGKVNHRNVSFKEQLKNGDIVEVLTSKTQKPKADWLNIVTTSKARNKIKAYLREEQAKAASLGREELERKLKNWKLPVAMDDAVTMLCKYYKFKTGTELYGQIAQQKIVIGDIKDVLTRLLDNETVDEVRQIKTVATKSTSSVDDALVIDESLSNIEYKLAKCCNPIYGDDIFAFTTINNGITIHRHDCPNAMRLKERYPYRVLPARWQKEAAHGSFRATVRIQADDVPGLVNKITEVINSDLKINIRSMSLNSAGGILSGLINICLLYTSRCV